jgi:hypothetical protein
MSLPDLVRMRDYHASSETSVMVYTFCLAN